MKSHTVPKKLLEQFAYDDPIRRSKWLWRYEKGRSPYGRASPKSATRWDGHFADPKNSAREAELEGRLQREFEDPVNRFIEVVGFKTFVLSQTHIRQLTGYVTALFNRSRARRAASQGQADTRIEAFRALLSDEQLLGEIAAKHTMDMIEGGYPLSRVVTKEDIAEGIEKAIQEHMGSDEVQHDYADNMELMMSLSDENMMRGEWNIINAEPEKPFVIGDAPVVTWERTDQNALVYGQGFGRPNVEVLLPFSPTACLHIRPFVERTRLVRMPTTDEVNIAQASFASDHCFANVSSQRLDATLQPHFGKMRIGIEGFSTRHIDYKKALFDILMNRGQSVVTSRH